MKPVITKQARLALVERVANDPPERVLARLAQLGDVTCRTGVGNWLVTWHPYDRDGIWDYRTPLGGYQAKSKLLVVAARRVLRQWAENGE